MPGRRVVLEAAGQAAPERKLLALAPGKWSRGVAGGRSGSAFAGGPARTSTWDLILIRVLPPGLFLQDGTRDLGGQRTAEDR
jgi:hypothetical protein